MKVKLNKGAFYGLTNGLCPFSWEVLEFGMTPPSKHGSSLKLWMFLLIDRW